MKKPRSGYLRTVVASFKAMLQGMKLTGKHYVKGYDREAPMGIADDNYFKKEQGPITIQYPMEKVPIPDAGRYRLYMETDDCIGCDKCARICPVDCITIETFRADGDLGRTTDGTMKRLHLPTFDIDMGKCMFCGLCTTVCPTECLTMTPVYDFSEYDRDNFVYHFGAYSPEEENVIRLATEASLAAKKAEKAATTAPVTESSDAPVKRRPMVQRGPATEPKPEDAPAVEVPTENNPETPPAPRPRPMLWPVMKKAEGEPETTVAPPENLPVVEAETDSPTEEKTTPRPRPRPVMQRKPEESSENQIPAVENPAVPETPAAEITPPRPRPRPVMQRKPEESSENQSPIAENPEAPETPAAEITPPRPRPRPIMRQPVENSETLETPPKVVEPSPAEETAKENNVENSDSPELPSEESPKPKIRPRPIMRKPENLEGGPEA